MSKDEVMRQYEQDYKIFFEILDRIPEDKKQERFFDGWGLKEILSHIAAWNLETIAGVETVMKGGIPWFFEDEEKINQFNEKAVTARDELSLAKIIEEVNINHSSLIVFLRGLDDDIFQKDFAQTWKEQKVTPALVCSYRHYIAHAKDILLFFS